MYIGTYTSPVDGMGRKGVRRNASIPQIYLYTYSSSYMFMCTPCMSIFSICMLCLISFVINICLTLLHILWGKYFSFPTAWSPQGFPYVSCTSSLQGWYVRKGGHFLQSLRMIASLGQFQFLWRKFAQQKYIGAIGYIYRGGTIYIYR